MSFREIREGVKDGEWIRGRKLGRGAHGICYSVKVVDPYVRDALNGFSELCMKEIKVCAQIRAMELTLMLKNHPLQVDNHPIQVGQGGDNGLALACREVEVLSRIGLHPNVVWCFGAQYNLEDRKMYIFSELIRGK